MLEQHNHNRSAHIRFEKVSLHYYTRPRWLGGRASKVLEEFSLSINTQNLAIVGPSGAGKSTLIELLFGLKKPTSGEIYVCDHPLSKVSEKQKRDLCHHIQLIPQDPMSSLNPYYKVKQILLEPLVNMGITKRHEERIKQVLQDVGLPFSLLHNNSQQLSVGQAQRVAIARALIVNPCVLVADEPTSSLDPVSRHQIINLLLKIQKTHQMRLVLVTHDLDAAQKLCDEILVLNKGQILEYGSSQGVIKNPKELITRSLIKAQNNSYNQTCKNHHTDFKLPTESHQAPAKAKKLLLSQNREI